MLDAVTLEVLWTRIISVVDEAAKAIVRTSFSTLSNEANDFACVLTDARGHSLAQNTGSIPSFIGTLPATVRHFLREFGRPDADAATATSHHQRPLDGHRPLSDVCVRQADLPRRPARRVLAATTRTCPTSAAWCAPSSRARCSRKGLHIPLMRLMRERRARTRR